MKLDLHIHSCFSDGGEEWDYAKIVNEAVKNSVELISITDHDVATDVILLKKHCMGTGVSFLTGAEFSSMLNGNSHDILGYGFDWHNDAIIKLMDSNLIHQAVSYNQKEDFWIELLIEAGYLIDWKEWTMFEGGAKPSPGNQFKLKILSFLIQKGICRDREDYFDRLYPITSGTPFTKLPTFPHPSEVIKVIKTAGGIPVLAHPVWRYNKLPLTDTLDLFKDLEIEGIECYRSDFNNETSNVCRQFCESNNLIITAGSDHHGTTNDDKKIGSPAITINECNLGVLMDKIIYY